MKKVRTEDHSGMLQEELRLAKEKAENVAKLYTDLYVEIYNFSPAGYFKLDPLGKICELNVYGAKMLTKDRSALINGYFNHFITKDSLSDFTSFFLDVFRKSSKESCEVRVMGNDGNDIHLHLEGILSEVEQKCLIAAVDITEQKLMEAELRESELNFRNLFEHLPIGISMTGLDNSLNANESLCKLFGYTKEELLEKAWMDITHPDDIQITMENIQNLISGKANVVRFEKRFLHKNGTAIPTELSSYLQRDKSGKPKFLITAVIEKEIRKKSGNQ
jgi:PAS domain S-box-containing protein